MRRWITECSMSCRLQPRRASSRGPFMSSTGYIQPTAEASLLIPASFRSCSGRVSGIGGVRLTMGPSGKSSRSRCCNTAHSGPGPPTESTRASLLPPVSRNSTDMPPGNTSKAKGASALGNSCFNGATRAKRDETSSQEPELFTVSKAFKTGAAPSLLMRATKSQSGVSTFSDRSIASSEARIRCSGTLRPVASARRRMRSRITGSEALT
mmetsp:Transcript_60385/g.184474  ORF Transcript_60385/g.184474 Transcript_60385/m.184474 type:complete len:210 (-) Transcript_60385:143-772(-)